MREALRALWRGINVFERFGPTFIIANVVALFCSIPLITLPAALGGLFRMGYVAQTSPTVHLDDFWQGFRAHFVRGLMLGMLNLLVIGILIANFSFFARQTGAVFVLLRLVWLIILLVWLAMQFYFWPILEEMEQPDVLKGLYNAAVMVLQNPYFTLVFLIGVLIILLVSVLVVVPLALLTLSMLSCISSAAVLNRLDAFRAR